MKNISYSNMFDKMYKSKTYESLLWVISAAIAGFGLGAMFDGFVSDYSVLIFIGGMIINTWMMIKVYLRD